MVKFGQHFLKNENILKNIVEYAKIGPDDVVLEIGAGDGRLTKYLSAAKKVYAVEIDELLFKDLKDMSLKNVEWINMDILDFDFPEDITKIVGNLPYEISSPITEKILLFMNKTGASAVLMYQREFAERMTAFPGIRDWSRISVLVNYYSEPKILKHVPRTMFRPAPKIESSIVRLIPKKVKPDNKLFDVTKALFMHKNKKVLNALIDSRDMLKTKDKNELKLVLPKLLGKMGDKKVFYLEIDEIQKIKERIKELI